MPPRFACAVTLAFVLSYGSVRAQHNQPPSHDLQGIWNGATLTPLQRPPEFKDAATFTPEQAAEYAADVRGSHPQPAADAGRSADAG